MRRKSGNETVRRTWKEKGWKEMGLKKRRKIMRRLNSDEKKSVAIERQGREKKRREEEGLKRKEMEKN